MDKTITLWDYEEPVSTLGIEVPAWIDPDITGSTLEAIAQGGCDSGAYMPAVTYHEARETMAKHGDEVFDFLEESGAEPRHVLQSATSQSWDGWACAILSCAVEQWTYRNLPMARRTYARTLND